MLGKGTVNPDYPSVEFPGVPKPFEYSVGDIVVPERKEIKSDSEGKEITQTIAEIVEKANKFHADLESEVATVVAEPTNPEP